MDDFDALARAAGADTDTSADERAEAARPPVLRLGTQTLDAARGVNRHHEMRMAHHYARLAQAVETPPDSAAPSSKGAGGLPA